MPPQTSLFTCSLAQYVVMLSKNRTTNWVEGGIPSLFWGAILGSSLVVATVCVSNSPWVSHYYVYHVFSLNEPQNVKAK